MKKIILSSTIMLFSLLVSCNMGKDNATEYKPGTGEGDKYVQVIKDKDNITPHSEAFADIISTLAPEDAGKTYKENKLAEAFNKLGNHQDKEKFLKALNAKKQLEEAKKNKDSNDVKIDEEFAEVLSKLKFLSDATATGSYEMAMKNFRDTLSAP
ncbi:hypothetical protein CDQ96_04520 (plasmid) [Borrelia miyamotoi]|nr:hypothetical protein CDQ96_04520 [Borrelia miyamotoi]